MSYGSLVREWLEGLLCDGSGTGRTITAGRFHRRVDDRQADAIDAEPQPVAERAIEVMLGLPKPLVPTNSLDGFSLVEQDVTIRVYYALTHAGGDEAEGLTSQHGPGTVDAVRDRAATDSVDLAAVLEHHTNWSVAGGDPHVIGLFRRDDDPPGFALRGDHALAELRYGVQLRVRHDTTAYAP